MTTDSMVLEASLAPWDTVVFRFPVACIQSITIKCTTSAQQEWPQFQDWLDAHGVKLLSARLPHDQLVESMFLEKQGFRFIEMVLHPKMTSLQSTQLATHASTQVSRVTAEELPSIAQMAEHAFGYERYHVDPRLPHDLADLRYGNWVRNSLQHTKQTLLKIEHHGVTAGFFIVEDITSQNAYWHLTAMNPSHKERGWATAVWTAMLAYHQTAGIEQVHTTISARNTPVLNLYSKLKFRFNPAEMTFHWLRGDT